MPRKIPQLQRIEGEKERFDPKFVRALQRALLLALGESGCIGQMQLYSALKLLGDDR